MLVTPSRALTTNLHHQEGGYVAAYYSTGVRPSWGRAMIHPDSLVDSKGKPIPFVFRWRSLVRVLLFETSVKAVALVAAEYADYDTGANCRPTNERLMRETSLGDRSVRYAWSVLRAAEMAERVETGSPHHGNADKYQLHIPDRWKNYPVLGPNRDKFTCQYCGEEFNPVGNCAFKSGKVTAKFEKLVFCPEPRKTKGRDDESCYDLWSDQQARAGAKALYSMPLDERFELFNKARDDDW